MTFVRFKRVCTYQIVMTKISFWIINFMNFYTRLSILHISPGRVSCFFLPQMHPDPICIFYLIPPGVVTCMPYSGSAGWGGTGLARALSHSHRSSKRSAGKCRDTLHTILGHLETKYCRSEKNARILRSSGI